MDGLVQPAGRAQPPAGPLLGGRIDPSGAGCADGGLVGAPGSRQCAGRPGEAARTGHAFDLAVQAGGYAWWYVDALSEDGRFGLTVIAFIGSVFSPYYARARRRAPGGGATAANHCAVNVALYGRGAQRWSMTERGAAQLQRSADSLRIGPSALRWTDDSLVIDIDEISAPWPTRVRGRVRIHPEQVVRHPVALARTGGHVWSPIAPFARVEVEFSEPDLRWSGPGYLDSNRGDAPLEQAFRRWDWSRAHLPGGRSIVLYEAARIGDAPLNIGLRFDPDGSVHAITPPPPVLLPKTGWRVERTTRCEPAGQATVRRTLTDAPFYARSEIGTHLLGEPVTAIHESLSLTRFASPWIQAMLPFRMPRQFWR